MEPVTFDRLQQGYFGGALTVDLPSLSGMRKSLEAICFPEHIDGHGISSTIAAISSAMTLVSRAPSTIRQRSGYWRASSTKPARSFSWKSNPMSSNRSSPLFLASPRFNATSGAMLITKVKSGSLQMTSPCSRSTRPRRSPRAAPWYTRVESANRSDMTVEPRASAGRIVFSRWSRRAAVNSRISVSADHRSGFPSTRRLRISSAPGDPPGSRVKTTSWPSDRRCADSRAACVDLPEPSIPSKVMKRPTLIP